MVESNWICNSIRLVQSVVNKEYLPTKLTVLISISILLLACDAPGITSAQMQRFEPKPSWIKVRPPGGPIFNRISSLLRERNLHTVCEEARCPNIAECWGGGTATLMLMGDVCTRGCRFCAVLSGSPRGVLDLSEPHKAAETVELMKLDYVVLTSVNRDDLPDGGASHFAKTIEIIHARTPQVLIEALIPDFKGDTYALKKVIQAKPEVLAHNLETVKRLTHKVRDTRATYQQSLYVLEEIKQQKPNQWTKSSMMLGLGETLDDLLQAFKDLKSAGVDFLTLGQYLQPSQKHLKVVEFISPHRFEELREKALEYGFKYVAAGPLVRSSYRAGEFYIASMVKNTNHSLPTLHSHA